MWRYYWIPSAMLLFGLWLGVYCWSRFAPGRDAPNRNMPAKVAHEKEQELYLTPGGRYTTADIQANGNRTASEKFTSFRASHDFRPRSGDRLCPVTRTRANPECTWVIGGQVYQFCCPPCIDEFLLLAKERPDQVSEPDFYVKR